MLLSRFLLVIYSIYIVVSICQSHELYINWMRLEYSYIHYVYQTHFFLTLFQVGFMTGPRPMTLHFILVASCVLLGGFILLLAALPSRDTCKSNSPSQLPQPFYTKRSNSPMSEEYWKALKDFVFTQQNFTVSDLNDLFFYISLYAMYM